MEKQGKEAEVTFFRVLWWYSLDGFGKTWRKLGTGCIVSKTRKAYTKRRSASVMNLIFMSFFFICDADCMNSTRVAENFSVGRQITILSLMPPTVCAL